MQIRIPYLLRFTCVIFILSCKACCLQYLEQINIWVATPENMSSGRVISAYSAAENS